jgi:hypothetical protein
MSNSRQDQPTQWLLVGTIAAALVVFWMLWGSSLFRPQGRYLGLDDLEHVGASIGGVFMPINTCQYSLVWR